MHLRRSLATTAAAVLITAPLLSSCGFNNSTDRVSDNTVGLDNRSGDASGGVDVLAAVIVAAQPGAGTFIATLSNTSPTDTATFESVEGAEDDGPTPGDSESVEIAPQGFANLADGGGVKLTGDFEAGDVVPLAISFASGQTVRMNVPVVRACEPYEGLDPAATESATPSAAPTDAPETVDPSGSAEPSASGSAVPAETADASASPYSCDFPRVGSTADSGEGE
jgi:hypothetical protein